MRRVPHDLIERMISETQPDRALRGWAQDRHVAGDLSRDELILAIGHVMVVIDELVAAQVNAILHHPRFQRLESTWRGVQLLVDQVVQIQAEDTVQLFVLDASWADIKRDIDRAPDFDRSQLFIKIYEERFGTATAVQPTVHRYIQRTTLPFGLLVGDYEVGRHPEELSMLNEIGHVAAAAFAPFLAAASPDLLGLDSFTTLERFLDLSIVKEHNDFAGWRMLRNSEDTRFVGLTLPRILMRKPYALGYSSARIMSCSRCGEDLRARTIDRCGNSACGQPFRSGDPTTYKSKEYGFNFFEDEGPNSGTGYLWGNAAFAFATVAIRSFAESGWLADIRGVRPGERPEEPTPAMRGGLVNGLPVHDFDTDEPGVAPRFSTNVAIGDVLEKELSELGLIALSRCKDTRFAAFYGNASVQKPKVYQNEGANMSARLSCMLQYVLCASRFAHYLKLMARDRVGSPISAANLELELSRWINEYVTADENASESVKAEFPLQEARIQVVEDVRRPGSYACSLHLRPHSQLDALTATVRFMTEISAAQPTA